MGGGDVWGATIAELKSTPAKHYFLYSSALLIVSVPSPLIPTLQVRPQVEALASAAGLPSKMVLEPWFGLEAVTVEVRSVMSDGGGGA